MSVVADACDRILACLQKTSLWDAKKFQLLHIKMIFILS
ncbi:MAG: hypothetical protein RLZZ574_668 [Cyanobacteriota bacterium]